MGFLFVCKHLNSLLTERNFHLIFVLFLFFYTFLVRFESLVCVRDFFYRAFGRIVIRNGWIMVFDTVYLCSLDNHRFHVFILNNGKKSKALPKFNIRMVSFTYSIRSFNFFFFFFFTCLKQNTEEKKMTIFPSISPAIKTIVSLNRVEEKTYAFSGKPFASDITNQLMTSWNCLNFTIYSWNYMFRTRFDWRQTLTLALQILDNNFCFPSFSVAFFFGKVQCRSNEIEIETKKRKFWWDLMLTPAIYMTVMNKKKIYIYKN